MWLLSNATPFAAERTWVRDRDGAEVWIVAVRGSFLIQADGQQVVDAVQTEVSRVPKFGGDPALSSLTCESDLVHLKKRTDVLVDGAAYGPNGRASARVDVCLRVATIDKTLRVHGDRRWHSGVLGFGLTAPEPFTRMPIAYERAFGGTDQISSDAKEHAWEPRNPVGTGFATRKEHLIDKLSPNIEDPRSPYDDWKRGQPAGFGPIARHWSPRVALAGTYDDQWTRTRKPLVPADFDDRFYQCAPEDQQVDGFLRGGETVEVSGMTPDGMFSFRVPRVSFVMTTRFYDGTVAQHRPVLHTLIISPDRRRFEVIWHSQLPCHHKVNKLEKTEVVIKRRINVPRAEVESGMWIGES
jgi:hypothetical protein